MGQRGILFIAISALLLWLPSVSAQEPPETPELPATATYSLAAEVNGTVEPILPIVETRDISITVTWGCNQASLRDSVDPVVVSFALSANAAYISAAVDPTTHSFEVSPEECLQGTEVTIPVLVRVALGEGPELGEQAVVTLNSTMDGTEVAHQLPITVEAGHYFQHEARFEPAIIETETSASTELTGVFENLGNARLTVSVKPEDGSEQGLEIVAPKSFQVEPFSNATFTVTVNTPSKVANGAQTDTIVVMLDTALASDESVTGETLTVQATMQTKQAAVEESAGMPTLVVPILVTLGLMRRRRTCALTPCPAASRSRS